MIRAVLDTSVLYHYVLRDVMLRAAERGMFQPVWSEEILAELSRALGRGPAFLDASKRTRLILAMTRSFGQACVSHDAASAPAPPLPDPDDRHIAATALVAGAGVIVTLNTRHFPAPVLAAVEVRVMTPDRFLLALRAEVPWILDEIVSEIVADHTRPPLTRDQFLDALARTAPRFAAAMRERR